MISLRFSSEDTGTLGTPPSSRDLSVRPNVWAKEEEEEAPPDRDLVDIHNSTHSKTNNDDAMHPDQLQPKTASSTYLPYNKVSAAA